MYRHRLRRSIARKIYEYKEEKDDIQYHGDNPGQCSARFTGSSILTGTPRGKGKLSREDCYPSRKPFFNSRTKPIMP